ncbi:MAG TPA: winged helix DNA-binding domain-containing protein [Blastocatellia bacterium]|nr:winged helix DNA-binding domain-containing protein [Blastocatellia bacterium]
MKNSDIANRRLYNQHIATAKFDKPSDVVGWMGAVQAQDYTGALWAVGLRARNATEEGIKKAIADKTIVRTWPMRRTLHFVAAADVRWMLELLTPRILAGSALRSQQLGLDERIFARSKEVFVRALEGGKQLRRDAMYGLLESARISTAGGRGLHIMCRLAMEGAICFGAREGKQPTFARLDEWVPAAKTMGRDEALAELAGRYFTSHGPATVQDFVWWSGLRTSDARAGLEMAKTHLVEEVIGGQTYWLHPSAPVAKDTSPTAYLLPAYDEYTVAYKDRRAVLDPVYSKQMNTGNGVFSPLIVVDGQVVGTWKRTLKKDALVITPSPFEKLNKAETRAVAAAANRYGEFLNVPVVQI